MTVPTRRLLFAEDSLNGHYHDRRQEVLVRGQLMALDTAVEWRDLGDAEMVEALQSSAPPETIALCEKDPTWWATFDFYARNNYADEAVDFLAAVRAFKASPDTTKAEAIYRQFVAAGAERQVNLYAESYEPLKEAFESGAGLSSVDMFDDAYEEVLSTLGMDKYLTFVNAARKVRAELAVDEDAEEGDAPIEVSGPVGVTSSKDSNFSRDDIDMAVVDKFNELALKDLQEGFSVNFYQLDDLVIIQAPLPTDDQPYMKWIRSQPGRTQGSTITMTAKGGAFSTGSVKVEGATDRNAVKAAIGRVSKKKVVFAD
jgi:hypothetical protein